MESNMKNRENEAGCPETGTLLLYSDSRLSADERLRIQRHIEHCAACKSIVEEETRMNALLDTVAIPELSEHFEIHLRKRLAKERGEQRRTFRFILVPIGAALGLFALAAGGLIGKISYDRLSGLTTEKVSSVEALDVFSNHPQGSISRLVADEIGGGR